MMSREKNGQEFKKEFIESSNSKNLYTHTLLTEKMAMFQHTIRNKCIPIYLRGNCHQ